MDLPAANTPGSGFKNGFSRHRGRSEEARVLPTLFHIPHEDPFLHLPIFGRGWLLIAWAVVGVLLLAALVRRQGWSADTRGYLLLLLVIGALIALVAPRLEEAGLDGRPIGLPIRSYGLMLLLGIVCGVGLAAWQARRVGLDPEVVYSVSFWMVLVGIAGARLFFVVQYWPQFQRETLPATIAQTLKFTEGGLVVYGALISGLAAALLFVRIRQVPALALGDILAPGMLLGLAIGRIGCLMNGCCFGQVCQLPAAPAVRFPAERPPLGQHSPAYDHQLRRGQLHGIRIAADPSGRPMIERIDADQSVPAAQLREGDIVRSIQLPLWQAYQAAGRATQLAGGELEIETVEGRRLRLPIPAPPSSPRPTAGGLLPARCAAAPPGGRNFLGFQARPSGGGGLRVGQVATGGPADQAGLRVGDELAAIRLPPVPTAEAAHNVLQSAGPQLRIETLDGRTASWSVGRLPDHSLPVHPAQIYSAINAALLCLLLWAWYPFRRRDGELIALMLTLYPLTRILLEAVRDDEPGRWGTPLTISQMVSLLVAAAAAVFWVYLVRRPPFRAFPTPRGA